MNRSRTRSLPSRSLYTLAALTVLGISGQSQGTLRGWGDEPWPVLPGYGFVEIATGESFSVARRTDGSLVTWGIGSGVWGPQANSPQGTGFVEVDAGSASLVALHSDGSIVAWGSDLTGIVSGVPAGNDFQSVRVGTWQALALRSDGSLVSWGGDLSGVVSGTPVGPGFVDIAAGWGHSLALRSDGTILSWGHDDHAQTSSAPSGPGFVAIEAGREHSMALHTDGTIHTWGAQHLEVVTNPPQETGFVQISTGLTHALALRPDGSILVWGDDGQSGHVLNAPPGNTFTYVDTGFHHSIAISTVNISGAYCLGEGPGSACPCGVEGEAYAGTGCPNSADSDGAKVVPGGSISLGDDSFFLLLNGTPHQKPCLILRGANQVNGGYGNPIGEGLLCVSGQIARSHVGLTNQAGKIFAKFQGTPFNQWTFGAGVPVNYQAWYRDPANTCAGSGFNFSNACTVTWEL